MTEIFKKVSDDDAVELEKTIVEVEALEELYNKIKTDNMCSGVAVQETLSAYMSALKAHKLLWTKLLNKYIGEDDASRYRPLLRFDINKKVIFLMNVKGCSLCEE